MEKILIVLHNSSVNCHRLPFPRRQSRIVYRYPPKSDAPNFPLMPYVEKGTNSLHTFVLATLDEISLLID